MTNEEIVNYEYNRKENTLNKIYLFKNNQDFWRANEWSCFLLHYYNKLNKVQQLKLSRVSAKAGNDSSIISCGLKLNSFNKFIPNAIEINVKEENSDKIKVFEVNLAEYSQDITLDNYLSLLQEFKDTIEITKIVKNSNNPYNNPITFTSIIQKIIRYSLYNKSEQDLVDFIQELKEDSCSLF